MCVYMCVRMCVCVCVCVCVNLKRLQNGCGVSKYALVSKRKGKSQKHSHHRSSNRDSKVYEFVLHLSSYVAYGKATVMLMFRMEPLSASSSDSTCALVVSG